MREFDGWFLSAEPRLVGTVHISAAFKGALLAAFADRLPQRCESVFVAIDHDVLSMQTQC